MSTDETTTRRPTKRHYCAACGSGPFRVPDRYAAHLEACPPTT